MARKGMDVFDEVGHLRAKDPGVPTSTEYLLKHKTSGRVGHKENAKGKATKVKAKASAPSAGGVVKKKLSKAMGY